MPRLHTVHTYEFRNLDNATWNFDHTEIFFTGKNGQGKTNFLESIYLLCVGSSFRTRRPEHLCRNGTSQARVNGKFVDQEVSVHIEGNTRKVIQNEKRIHDRRELLLQFPCVVFVHEDITFVTGSPDMRRRYLDQCLSISELTYLPVLRSYKRILQKKNASLKSGNFSVLPVLNLQLVQYGLQIQGWREDFVDKMSPVMSERYKALLGTSEKVKMEYLPSWKQDQEGEVMKHLTRQQSLEELIKTSLSGPHRDNIRMFLNDVPVENGASMGQLRAISLVYRIVQAEIINTQQEQRPILLFDDVLLELDSEKKGNFAGIIPPFSQAFFTFLGYEHFETLQHRDVKIYEVDHGRLVE